MKNGYFFIVVCWGERFRNYFLDYCLPSLLAPGNIPALENKPRSKFLICTTDEDWMHICANRSIMLLEQHIEAVHVRIPPCPPDKSGCQHMGIGHRLAAAYAHRKRACAMFLQPDTMISDGAIVRLQELHADGKKLVVCPAVRFDEDRLFANLGIVTAPRLILDPQKLAQAAAQSLHPETAAYRWDAPYSTTIFPVVWWPLGDAMIMHTISWEPLLVDYTAIDDHDVSTFDHWTIDGDYLGKNFPVSEDKIHVVQSTDEICFVGFTPAHEGPQWPRISLLRWRRLRNWVRKGQMRRMFNSVHEFQRELFRLPLVWNGPALAGEYYNSVVADALGGKRRGDWVHILVETFLLAWVAKGRIARRVGRALTGDRKSMRDLGYSVRYVWRQMRA